MIMVRKVSKNGIILLRSRSCLSAGCLKDFLLHFLSGTPLGKGNFLFSEQINPTEFSYSCRIVKVLIAEAEMHPGVLNPDKFVQLCIKSFSFVNFVNSVCTVAEKCGKILNAILVTFQSKTTLSIQHFFCQNPSIKRFEPSPLLA